MFAELNCVEMRQTSCKWMQAFWRCGQSKERSHYRGCQDRGVSVDCRVIGRSVPSPQFGEINRVSLCYNKRPKCIKNCCNNLCYNTVLRCIDKCETCMKIVRRPNKCSVSLKLLGVRTLRGYCGVSVGWRTPATHLAPECRLNYHLFSAAFCFCPAPSPHSCRPIKLCIWWRTNGSVTEDRLGTSLGCDGR